MSECSKRMNSYVSAAGTPDEGCAANAELALVAIGGMFHVSTAIHDLHQLL